MQTDDGSQIGLAWRCDSVKAPVPLKQGVPRECPISNVQFNHLRNLSQSPIFAEGAFNVSAFCRFVPSFVNSCIWFCIDQL